MLNSQFKNTVNKLSKEKEEILDLKIDKLALLIPYLKTLILLNMM
jgi:hypothetical protein